MRNQATRNFAGRLAYHSAAVLLLLIVLASGALTSAVDPAPALAAPRFKSLPTPALMAPSPW